MSTRATRVNHDDSRPNYILENLIVRVVKLTQIVRTTCPPARMATLQQDINKINYIICTGSVIYVVCIFHFKKKKTTNIALDYYPEVEESPYRTSISSGKSLIMVLFKYSIVSLDIP